MSDCVFCKIMKNEIPSFVVFEDDLVKVIMDINPVSEGHLLIIPKKHFENIFDADKEVLERINVVAQKMSILCKEKLNCTGVNILNASGKDAQQSVFHLHYHIVPRYQKDGIDLWFPNNKDKIDTKSVFEKLKK